MPFILYRNTKDRVDHEQEADLIDQMEEAKEAHGHYTGPMIEIEAKYVG